MRVFTVSQSAPLLETLFRLLSDTKKTRVREFLKRRGVTVNGLAVTRFDHLLKPGDRIAVHNERSRPAPVPERGIRIVYEDESVIVVEKPAGLLSIATEKVRTQTAFYAVNEYLNRVETAERERNPRLKGPRAGRKQIFIVHRLDQEVSGLMIFAKEESIKLALQRNWKSVRKKYYAVVEGRPKEGEGVVTSYLRENKFLKVYSSRRPDAAKLSTTRYRVLQGGPSYSLLEVELETGRKHQIRVHLADLGCPIAGDTRYGAKTDPAGRVALHAYSLALAHPGTGKPLAFETDLPEALSRIVSQDESAG